MYWLKNSRFVICNYQCVVGFKIHTKIWIVHYDNTEIGYMHYNNTEIWDVHYNNTCITQLRRLISVLCQSVHLHADIDFCIGEPRTEHYRACRETRASFGLKHFFTTVLPTGVLFILGAMYSLLLCRTIHLFKFVGNPTDWKVIVLRAIMTMKLIFLFLFITVWFCFEKHYKSSRKSKTV